MSKIMHIRDSATLQEAPYVFWPGDLLPLEFPRARILVFGYDTVVAKHQFAGASLAICSTSNIQSISDILKSTTAVMFLGTPHRGSTAAGVGEIARKAASLLLMDTNPRVLDSLSLKNSDLERCQYVFASLWSKHDFRVKTFQEGLPLRLPIRLGQSKMVKVVPDFSSYLGDERERAETLNGDHRSICRYASTQDPNYQKVAAELRVVYTTLTSKSLAVRANQCSSRTPSGTNITYEDQGKLECFEFPGALFRQLSIRAPAENTCQWLPDTEPFRAWIERSNVDSHLGFFQIIGKPGSGKSTLMRKAFDTTRTRFPANTGICVLGHFFDRGGQLLQHSATGILRSLLYQLGNQHPASLRATREYTQADLQLLESSNSESYLDILKSSLEAIFSNLSLSPRRTIIFVDALDECDSSDAVKMGYFLAQLTRSAHSNGVGLDVCISRREYPSITVNGSLEIHMDSYNGDDIKQYMYQKFQMANIPSGDQELLIKTISQRSNSIFLWVVLVVEGILKDVENGQNTKYILDRTNSLPGTLESLYEQIITDMDPENCKMAFRLFQWALLPTDRLRIREWHHILAFIREDPPTSLREWKESDYYTETDSQLELRIRNLSQGLVEVKCVVDISTVGSDSGSLRADAGSLDSTIGDSRVVQPIHETVSEFFTSGRADWLYPNHKMDYYGFQGGGHLLITSTCLTYICIMELDGLVWARQLPENSKVRIRRGRSITREEKKWLRRRSGSVTSFMSSASSHSKKYHFQDQDDSMDDDVDGDVDDDDGLSNIISASSRTRSRQSSEIEHLRSSWCGPSPPDPYKTDSMPSPQMSIPTSKWILQIQNQNVGPSIAESISPRSPANSLISHTLKEYPALKSYAINRAFEHARAALAIGADPGDVLRKLVLQNCWERWYMLQEHASDLFTWQDMLKFHNLDPWISIAEKICEEERYFHS
ncbi:hypothetical protein F4803DRAFT_529048 [Xylaria telfairii]|nr:hypothetical protein F4803DRAFT_529048 [Xylaria telfairii]